jgi:hypothetical protein
MTKAHLGNQALEAEAAFSRRAGTAKIIVDDGDAQPRPAQSARMLGTVKLSTGRLAARNFPSRLLMKLAR